ncbi:MAG: VOC family protein [Gammaproteobacteria bacterium]
MDANHPGPAARDAGVFAHARTTVTLRVRDVAASVQWYRRVFRIEPFFLGLDTGLTGSERPVAGFRMAGVKVWLTALDHGVERRREDNDRNAYVAFLTAADLGALRRELQARGAIFDDAEPVEGCRLREDGVRVNADTEILWLYDPDWNRIEFCRVIRDTNTLGAPATPSGAS